MGKSGVGFDFSIIGGDTRLQYMAENLRERGYSLTGYGAAGETVNSLAEAVCSSKNIVAGIPFSRDGKHIFSLTKHEDLTLDNLKNLLTENHVLFAGCIGEDFLEFGRKNNITMHDFMKDEKLTFFNTLATAEGAIAEAITRHPQNIHGSNILVLGYGRCAKILAHKLSALNASVTICARNDKALAEASAFGKLFFKIEELKEHIGEFEYIFNTIPKPIITDDILSKMDKSALLMDIAPGGFNPKTAEKLNLNAVTAPGLPGRYAPKASGTALANFLIHCS